MSLPRLPRLFSLAIAAVLVARGLGPWAERRVEPAEAAPAGPMLSSPSYLPLAARSLSREMIAPPQTAAPATTPTPTPLQTRATPAGPGPTPTPSVTATSAPTLEIPPTSNPADCGTVVTFETGRVPAAMVYVATTGSDASGDGSPERPFATIRRAAQSAAPGTAIRVRPGTYRGGAFIDGLRGTADAPIWLGGAPGEARPIIEGAGEAIHLVKPAYLVIHDLEVRNSTANGLNVDDGGDYANAEAAHHIVFRGLDIHDVGSTGNQDCLKLSGLSHFHVLDSAFRVCGGGGSGSGIDVVGGHHGLVARSRFTDLSANAVQAKGGSADIEVWANHMQRAGGRALNMGGSTGFEFFRPPLSSAAPNAEARDIRVVANVIEGSEAPVAYVGCVDCLVANNTLVDPGRWVMRILQETVSTSPYVFEPSSRGRFENNLVYFDRSRLSTFANVGANTVPDTFSFGRNLWYAHDNPARSQPSLPVAERDGIVGRDPRFTTGHEIGPDSPAVGAGAQVEGLRADARGKCYADPPSIGAYEGR